VSRFCINRVRISFLMPCRSFLNLMLLAIMGIVCAVADSTLEKYYYPLGAPWLFADNQSDNNPSINGLVTFVFALITFQNIVPISLYISIEFVRTAQAAFIYFDRNIWYEKTDQPTLARSWNLSDDLGQIEYIFSDKTGTLTQVRAICVIYESGADFGVGTCSEHHGVQEVLDWRQGLSRRFSGRGNADPRTNRRGDP
jgi:hypothetical protein